MRVKNRLKVELSGSLKRIGLVLGASLCGWNASTSVGLAQGLSTDLLEMPIEERPIEEIPVEEIPVEERPAAETPAAETLEGLPLSEEIPEEILRTEIITGARSPITGEPMTAADYAQLQAELDEPAGNPLVSSDIRYLVFLLQVRRAVRPILPFIR